MKLVQDRMNPTRRGWLARSLGLGALGILGLLGACSQPGPKLPPPPPLPAAETLRPIVFVHGNGDSAATWITTQWRFESNGWPRERLHAIDLPYPLARDLDDVPQPGRTSTAEHRDFLAAEIDKVLKATGAQQVVLIGNSRGGNAIRNYVRNGGAARVSHAILGGTPNHGVQVNAQARLMNEFNGAGPFLTGLNNQGAPGVEVTPGPMWMTVRSDANDKFAQPDGEWLGAKGTPTGVTAAGPELKGAANVVLANIDHRETSYGPQAFAETFRFITGLKPRHAEVQEEARVTLDGKLTGQGLNNDPATGGYANNLPLVGAKLEIFATDPVTGERRGSALWRKTVGADGRWGPFAADGRLAHEFVITAQGYATTHIYRSAFPRSSTLVHLRAERLNDADKAAAAVVVFSRPRGYFGLPRDRVVLDGIDPAPGVPKGVAGVASSRLRLTDATPRAVPAQFNNERLVGRVWPTAGNHLVVLELQY